MQVANLLRLVAALADAGMRHGQSDRGGRRSSGPLVLPFDGTLAVLSARPVNDHVAGRLKKLSDRARKSSFSPIKRSLGLVR